MNFRQIGLAVRGLLSIKSANQLSQWNLNSFLNHGGKKEHSFRKPVKQKHF